MTLFIKNYYKVFFLLLLAFWCGYEAHKEKIFPLKRFIVSAVVGHRAGARTPRCAHGHVGGEAAAVI